MAPLRAFLFFRNSIGTEVTVHRDLEAIAEIWNLRPSADCSGLIHIGFERPEVADVRELLELYEGRILLSGSAKFSLPERFRSSTNPVQTIGNLPIYLCLNGFGYEISDDSVTNTHSGRFVPVVRPEVFRDVDRWLEAFFGIADYATELLSAGINSDSSYVENECKLPTLLRKKLSRARYRFSVGEDVSAYSILGNLKYCPPWLLGRRFDSFPLSVRAANVMSSHSVYTYEDLSKYTEIDIRRFANLGKKTFDEISQIAVEVFESGPELSFVAGRTNLVPRETSTSLPDENIPIESNPLNEASKSFIHAWDYVFNGLREVDKSVIAKRAGINQEATSLQEISEGMSITRERVRQIEARAVATMSGAFDWDSSLGNKLSTILRGRSDGLLFEGLEVFDPWFSRISMYRVQFEYALEHFLPTPYHFVKIGLQTFVTQISQRKWETSIVEARKILAAIVEERPTRQHVRLLIDSLIAGDADELKDEFWAEASKHASFTTIDGHETYVGYGHGIEPKVLKILEGSDHPLHYTAIHRALLEDGYECDIRRVSSAAASIGMLYSRGVYGAKRHLSFNELEKEKIISSCLEFILSEGPERQWHADELVDCVISEFPDFSSRLDKFILTIILKESSEFVYLQRLVWALKSTGATGSANRIDRLQATIAAIQEAGQPLTSKQIRERISEERGLGKYFLIFPDGPLVKVDASKWGLIDRDVPLTTSQITEFYAKLEEALKRRDKAVHLSELQDFVRTFLPVAATLDPNCLVSLATRSSKFASTNSDYIYLREWGGPKRIGLLEACRRVFQDADGSGISKADFLSRVCELIERDISSPELNGCFANLGAVYDPITKLWKLDDEFDE